MKDFLSLLCPRPKSVNIDDNAGKKCEGTFGSKSPLLVRATKYTIQKVPEHFLSLCATELNRLLPMHEKNGHMRTKKHEDSFSHDLPKWIKADARDFPTDSSEDGCPNTILLNLTKKSNQIQTCSDEGYQLVLMPPFNIVISSGSEAGLFYGVQTLAQVFLGTLWPNQVGTLKKNALRGTMPRNSTNDTKSFHTGHGKDNTSSFSVDDVRKSSDTTPKDITIKINPFHINDYCAFANRGYLLDISRDRVPTLEHLYDLIDCLAHFKYNQLQLYMEHTFSYEGHDVVWKEASPLCPADILALDSYCRKRYIALIPCQNTLGHMHRWLIHDAYAHLAENLGGTWTPFSNKKEPFSFCPTDPKTHRLIEDLLSQLLPLFSTTVVNINLDETFDVGTSRSKDACINHELKRGGVLLDFLRSLRTSIRDIYKKLSTNGVPCTKEHLSSMRSTPLKARDRGTTLQVHSPLPLTDLDEVHVKLDIDSSNQGTQSNNSPRVPSSAMSEPIRYHACHKDIDISRVEILCWADSCASNKELVDHFPDDVTLLEWGYEAKHPFEARCKVFHKAQKRFYVCPGTSSWCSFSGRWLNAYENIVNATRAGIRYGAVGFLLTDWGDFGHLQPSWVSDFGIICGSHFSWHGETDSRRRQNGKSPQSPGDQIAWLQRCLDLHIFRDLRNEDDAWKTNNEERIVRRLSLGDISRKLGDIYRICGTLIPNYSALFFIFAVPEPIINNYLVKFALATFVGCTSHYPLLNLANCFYGLVCSGCCTGFQNKNYQDVLIVLDRCEQSLIERKKKDKAKRSDEDMLVDEFVFIIHFLRFMAQLMIERIIQGMHQPLYKIPEQNRQLMIQNLDEIISDHQRIWSYRSRDGGLNDSIAKILALRHKLAERLHKTSYDELASQALKNSASSPLRSKDPLLQALDDVGK
eukprot:g3753.t1